MTVKGGTTPACAACAYQRRKCSPTCPLAPYFPASQPRMFRSVHRLFGVSNVTKLLDKIEPEKREDAMRSIIYEAEIREKSPVEGCCGIIIQLSQQLHLCIKELHYVRTILEALRQEMVGQDKVVDPSTTSKNAVNPSMDYWSGFNEAPPQHGQLFLNGNGDGLYPEIFEPYSNKMNNWPSTIIQAQMDDCGVNDKINNIEFEAKQSYIETKMEA